jgi:uncharacterized DUF497 family protein
MEFSWNGWNLDHATRHGVSVLNAEAVVRRGLSRRLADNKYQVRGRGVGERLIQVIYIIDSEGTIYVIHARPLSEREKRQFRRRNHGYAQDIEMGAVCSSGRYV